MHIIPILCTAASTYPSALQWPAAYCIVVIYYTGGDKINNNRMPVCSSCDYNSGSDMDLRCRRFVYIEKTIPKYSQSTI